MSLFIRLISVVRFKRRLSLTLKMFFGLAILCLVAVPTALCEKIHERMTASQRAQIFQRDHHSLVPDYEVVQFKIPRRNKRHSVMPRALNLHAFQDNVLLYLVAYDGALVRESTPVYMATGTKYGNVAFKEIPNLIKDSGVHVADTRHSASLMLNTNSKGQYTFDGFVGSKNLVVRSLPESISYDLERNNLSNYSDASEESRTTKSAYHVVFKREEKDSDEGRSFCALGDPTPRFQTQNNSAIPPEIVHPEITVVVDYELYGLHGFDKRTMVRYLIAFWNAVDFMYRDFSQPKIRLNIARIIIANNHWATPYLENYPYIIYYNRALDKTSMYFYSALNDFADNNSDIVMMMTNRTFVNDTGHAGVIGIAQGIGVACTKNDSSRQFNSLGMTTDDGRFTYVFTAAHELAHLFGSLHDGWKGGNYCNESAGYIMTPEYRITRNAHDFSPCSVQSIKDYFKNGGGNCMLNTPRAVYAERVYKFLPASIINRDVHCQKLGYVSDCYNSESWKFPCNAVYCIRPDGKCEENTHVLPVDGANCGHNGICLHQECVAES